MRMHTDKLEIDDIDRIAREALPSAVELDVSQHGSRKRARGFELHLNAPPGRDRFGNNRRYANSGSYGANAERYAATWYEWGDLIAALFLADTNAIIGEYDNPAEFVRLTGEYNPDRSESSPWADIFTGGGIGERR